MNLDHELLDLGRALMRENYPHLDLFNMEIIQSGGIKTIWKLETSIGTVCLKRIRKNLPIVKFTTAAQVYLSKKGARVADIVPTKNHQLYFVHEGYALVLYMWIEGSELEMDKDSEHLRTALKGLAHFHNDTCGFVPPEDCEFYDRMGVWPDRYNEMRGELAQWKSISEKESSPFYQAYRDTVDDMIRMAERALRLLQNSCYTDWVLSIGKGGYMCHQDYGKGNALQTEQGVYILDLDNLAYDIPLRDVRKLITKRMEELDCWDQRELSHCISCYTSILPLSEEQKQVLYIDLLFPHTYYGDAKNPFKKGKRGEAGKILKSYQFEMKKLSVFNRFVQI